VTFSEYEWAKNAEKKFNTYSLVFPIWQLENGHDSWKMLENPMLKVVSFLGHKNIIATAIPMLSGLTFSMAITLCR